MSVNYLVTESSMKVVDASSDYGVDSVEFRIARQNYWSVFEAEAMKDPEGFMGWAALEDPADVLSDFIYEEEDRNFVEDVLDDYLKFGEIVSRVTGKDMWSVISKELVEGATEYIAR